MSYQRMKCLKLWRSHSVKNTTFSCSLIFSLCKKKKRNYTQTHTGLHKRRFSKTWTVVCSHTACKKNLVCWFVVVSLVQCENDFLTQMGFNQMFGEYLFRRMHWCSCKWGCKCVAIVNVVWLLCVAAYVTHLTWTVTWPEATRSSVNPVQLVFKKKKRFGLNWCIFYRHLKTLLKSLQGDLLRMYFILFYLRTLFCTSTVYHKMF